LTRALTIHTIEFYKELEKRAERNENDILVFTGHTTKVMNYLGISSAWYSRIRDALLSQGCIAIHQRGTIHQPSIIVLRGEPTSEKISAEDLTSAGRTATLVERLDKRLAALEAWRIESNGTNVMLALVNIESRLSRLERLVKPDESNGNQE